MSTHSDHQVRAITLANATMQQAVETLREMRIPVCFEQIALVPERARRLADGSIEYERTHFDAAFPGGTISAALDALCRADPDYTWEQIGNRPTYVVFPVSDSALTWSTPSQDVTEPDWIAAIQSLNLGQYNIALFPRGLERQPRATLPASLLAETVVRRWLTAVVDFVNQGRCWTLGGVAGSRTLVIGQVPLAVDARN
jgi:hypothetical protein